jgi:PPOX class probable F420-dependent enzyme
MNALTPVERTFAERHRVARLATADGHGTPHVIPVVYATTDVAVYFIVDDKPKGTRTGLKRLRNIERNPQVALLIDDYAEDWTALAYLLIHGRAAVVADREEYLHALGKLRDRYPQYRSMPLAFESHPMVRIVHERSHFWQAAAARPTCR